MDFHALLELAPQKRSSLSRMKGIRVLLSTPRLPLRDFRATLASSVRSVSGFAVPLGGTLRQDPQDWITPSTDHKPPALVYGERMGLVWSLPLHSMRARLAATRQPSGIAKSTAQLRHAKPMQCPLAHLLPVILTVSVDA